MKRELSAHEISMDIPGVKQSSPFDDLIDSWNKMPPNKRNAIARECLVLKDGKEQHIWMNVVSKGRVRYVVCERCRKFNPDFRRSL